MKLTELFDVDTATGEWTHFGNTWYASFTIGELLYAVRMSKQKPLNVPELANGSYQLVFGVDDGDSVDSEIRGVGNEMKVFSNVVALVRKFLTVAPILPIVMSAKESNRASLYGKMASRLLPTWNVTKGPNEYGGTSFVITPPSQ